MSISKLSYVIAASTLLLAGCGGSAAPTGNSSGPASGAVAGNAALLTALDNMVAAKTAFRYESSNTTKGNFGGPGAQGGQAAAPGERTVKTMGEVNGRNSHITTQGNFGGGAGGNAGQEFIFADGKSFVKGPNPNMGAIEAKWYELPADRAQRNPADGLFARDGKRMLEPADFKKTTSETIDGKRCDIYEADAAALQRIYDATQTGFGVGGFGGPGGGGPGPQGGAQAGQGQGQGQNAGQGGQGRNQLTIKSGSYKVWACEDNIVRKYEVNFALTSAQRADQALEIQSSTRLYDFGTAINIAAPAGAAMAESPNRPNNPANGTPRAPGTPRAGTPRP
ncbi:MAG: hypothetical protein KIH69_009195 [Anaerolineae bacterium]|nr:hypothetical protein [Anaerolineae bacterium]